MESVLSCDLKSVASELSPASLFPCCLFVGICSRVLRGGGRAAPRTANETIYFVCQLELLQRFRNQETTVIAKPL
jgi:hypothetical protein